MPKQQTDFLLQLIRSLTKSEKRHFRLFVTRNQNSDDILFLRLFEELDKQKNYDEASILKKITGIKKQQLSNLKAHLYKQLLLCLRLIQRTRNEDIDMREKIDYAKVLYNKGLYRQSLDMLDKVKSLATKLNHFSLALEVIEFEKHIESQYITHSIDTRAEELSKQSLDLIAINQNIHTLSNLSLQLYGLYLKTGFVRNEKDFYYVKEFFFSKVPNSKEYSSWSFNEKMFFTQSHVWYYYIIQDFPMYYRYAQKWVDLFHETPSMMEVDMATYIKGLNNLLNAQYYIYNYERFVKTLEELENIDTEVTYSDTNIQGMVMLFKYIHRVNKYYMEGEFAAAVNEIIPELEQILEENTYNWDVNRVLVFYYRIACLYFASGNNEKAIDYLNLIINQKAPDIREDIQCFARILNLIAHFELGNAQLVEYQVKSVFRFIAKMKDLHLVQKEVLNFIRKIPQIKPAQLKKEFVILKATMIKINTMPYERRAFLYLDIISWLESKIEHIPVQEVVRRKFQNRNIFQIK